MPDWPWLPFLHHIREPRYRVSTNKLILHLGMCCFRHITPGLPCGCRASVPSLEAPTIVAVVKAEKRLDNNQPPKVHLFCLRAWIKILRLLSLRHSFHCLLHWSIRLLIAAMTPALALHPRGVCQQCTGEYPCAAWVGRGMDPSSYGARQVTVNVALGDTYLISLLSRSQQRLRKCVWPVPIVGLLTTAQRCHHRIHQHFNS